MKKLLLLDSASLYFRAFYGVPDSIKAPDGTVVNALRGMIEFVATLVTAHQPTHVVACWDNDWRPQWRVDLIESYKAHRVVEVTEVSIEEVPDLLTPQVPLIAEALSLLAIPVVGAPAAEADDVIGSYVAQWDGAVDVVTGDRDLFQLVDDSRAARILYTARGVRDVDVVDDAWILAKYGVRASQYVDYAVMRGDPSDGLPGVPGIGEKTAATLLAEFGDLTGIEAAALDASSSLRPRIRQSLLDSRAYIAAARQVVAVSSDLEVPTPLPLGQAADYADFAEQWGVAGSMARAEAAITESRRD